MRKKTIEDYVEVIYILQQKKKIVHTTGAAAALNINPASVTEVFQKLANAGYIHYKKYSGVTLTPKGQAVAVATKKKHDMVKEFLLILGVNENVADDDVCRIEHVVNPQTVNRLTKFVDFVHRKEEGPRWLDHFKYFNETGEYVECSPSDELTCPVHGRKK